jgi:hypothetical protein
MFKRKKVPIYSDSNPEEFLTWMENLGSLITGQNITVPNYKYAM